MGNALVKVAKLNLTKCQINDYIMHSVVGLADALNGKNFGTRMLMGWGFLMWMRSEGIHLGEVRPRRLQACHRGGTPQSLSTQEASVSCVGPDVKQARRCHHEEALHMRHKAQKEFVLTT